MPALYPRIEPYGQGLLEVGDGQRVYWEQCGNPAGRPALVLHGGPGSGSSPAQRRLFDPSAYRIVLFDQRGCGRSTPHASEPRCDLAANTTAHLLADIEVLRAHLEVADWLVFGGSWGTTLALAYAEAFPARVRALVLAGVTTSRRSEIDWLYRGLAPLFPAEWERFRAGAGADVDDAELLEAYHGRLHAPDPAVRAAAASAWHDWEAASLSADPGAGLPEAWSRPAFQLARARLCAHYFRHGAWLEEGALLRRAGALSGIPGMMVQGRLDLQAPLVTAWELARAWPEGELVVVAGAGHTAADPRITEAILTATTHFAHP